MKRRNTSWNRALRLLRRKLGNRRLFADDELQFRDEVGHQPAVRSQRLQKRLAPTRQLGVALAEQRSHQTLKGLRQRRIGDVALVLVELARGEKPARRHKRLVQLVDDGRFADAGIARDQNQLRRAALDHAIEGGEQRLDLALSPVKLLRDHQPIGPVAFAERKRLDAPVALPFGEAAPQIVLDAGGGLVALLGRLGEQLHDDLGDSGRDALQPLRRRRQAFGRYGSGPIPSDRPR